MALQGITSYDQGRQTHKKFSSIHRRRGSLDGDQLGHHHFVGVKGPIQELSAKNDERIRWNHNSNYKEEEQQQQQKPEYVWDCESKLYDSFELYSFSRQLNRAIAAASTSSSVINSHQLVGGVRSWSMPHCVSTKSTTISTEWQCSPVNVEINLQEEKLRSQIVAGNTDQITIHDRHQTVAQNVVERQLDTRQTRKTHEKRMGFLRSVQRLFTRLIHNKAGSCKPKNTMETEAVDGYCYKSVYPEQQDEKYNRHSRGLSIHRSEFVPKVRRTVSERITAEGL